jgi:hypothetical protein
MLTVAVTVTGPVTVLPALGTVKQSVTVYAPPYQEYWLLYQEHWLQYQQYWLLCQKYWLQNQEYWLQYQSELFAAQKL